MDRRRHPDRLDAVASLVRRGARVADVGTDHGLLACRLVRGGRVAYCIASDRSRPALAAARQRLWALARGGNLELRLGDGLAALRPEDRVDTVVLAGLGARSIIRILGDDRLTRLTVRHLVLQPQSRAGLLRRWLGERGWTIVGEKVVREGRRFYEVIAADAGVKPADLGHPRLDRDTLLEAGPCLVRERDPVALMLWTRRVRHLGDALERSRGGESEARVAGRLHRARAIVSALR